jgi:hypothetical protein
MDEDVIMDLEEVMDVVAIMFGDVMVIIVNQMKIIRGVMKKKITHHLVRNLKMDAIEFGIENYWSRTCRTPNSYIFS